MAQFEDKIKRNKKILKRRSVRVDLTSMVDLGFLLITFFIFTTSLTQPAVTRLFMPKDSHANTLIKENTVLTLMLAQNDSITYYEGMTGHYNYCKINNVRSVILHKKRLLNNLSGIHPT